MIWCVAYPIFRNHDLIRGMQHYFCQSLWWEKWWSDQRKVHTLLHFWCHLWCNFKMERISCQYMFSAMMQFLDGSNLLPDFVGKSVPYPFTLFFGPPMMQFQDGEKLEPDLCVQEAGLPVCIFIFHIQKRVHASSGCHLFEGVCNSSCLQFLPADRASRQKFKKNTLVMLFL